MCFPRAWEHHSHFLLLPDFFKEGHVGCAVEEPCRAQGEVTLLFSYRIQFSWAGLLVLAMSNMSRYHPSCSLSAAPCALCSGGVSGTLRPPSSLGKDSALCCRHVWVCCQADIAGLELVTAKLSGFKPIPSVSSSPASLGTCYLSSSAIQSVWAPAVLPHALLLCIKESQWFAVPDSLGEWNMSYGWSVKTLHQL